MPVFSPAEYQAMQRTQESSMDHEAMFQRYDPETDSCSGQLLHGTEAGVRVRCGLKQAEREPGKMENSDGGTISPYVLRLPRWMEAETRPMSRFVVDRAHGQALARPLTLEQVGEEAVGPSGVVVRARQV